MKLSNLDSGSILDFRTEPSVSGTQNTLHTYIQNWDTTGVCPQLLPLTPPNSIYAMNLYFFNIHQQK